MRKLTSVIGALALLVASVSLVLGTGQPKVTICHAAGLEGTTQFVTLTIAYPAVYGPAGHFHENGTTRAGHEQDCLGACIVETTPTPQPTPVVTPTPEPTPTETPTETPVPSMPDTATR